MPPIRKGDGTAVAPKGISQVRTGDGRILFDGPAIPDSEDLHAHYDFSQEDGTLPVEDLAGSNDLNEGTYSGVSVDINGVQAGEFDGVDDGIWPSSFSNLSQPFTIFTVLDYNDSDDNEHLLQLRDDETLARFGFLGEWDMRLSANSLNGSGEGGLKLHSLLYNDSNSLMREEGSQTASGSVGDDNANTFGIGSQEPDDSDRYSEVNVGEVLVYEGDKSSIFGGVESYLSNKWGVSI